MTTVPQTCGHRLSASHIERPQREYRVEWMAPTYHNVLTFAGGRRWARVFAETATGALRVAHYHHPRATSFTVRAESD